jgi:hypothetical protein
MVCDCERVSRPDVGTSEPFLEHIPPNSGLLKTTMRCSGGSKCDCTLFIGGHCVKRCKNCSHDRNSHYEPHNDCGSSSDCSGSENITSDTNGNSNTDNDDSGSDDSDDGSDGGGESKLQSTRMKNRMTVDSLVADLINGGEHSKVEVENAKKEAKAGLTRQQVSLMFARLQRRSPNLQRYVVWV